MDENRLSERWILAAITYFLLAVALAVYMGASGDHKLFSVHSHLALLGWASMALTGVLYRLFPAAARGRLAQWHFWLYQLAVPALLVAVAALYSGQQGAAPLAGIASTVVFVSVLLFWWAIFSTLRGRKPARTG